MESMQASFEAEARAKVEALKSKKKLEQDIVELESALDNANRGRADADKAIKKLQQQIRDIEAVRYIVTTTISASQWRRWQSSRKVNKYIRKKILVILVNPLMDTLKPLSNGPLYDRYTGRWWLGFYICIARRGLGGLRPRPVPSSL